MTDNKQRNTHTMTFMKIGIGVAIAACAAVIAVPALKGPINRYRNEANEQLNAEYVVDNYKAEYVSLHDKKQKVAENLQKFRIEQKVTEKKLAYAIEKVETAKKNLVENGTSDMQRFNRAKDAYETAKIEVANFVAMNGAYSNAIVKLENALYLIEANMSKAKVNVTALESKKVLVDSITAVNETVESLNGVDNSNLGISIEKLDDDLIRESIKLEALRESTIPAMDKNAAEDYLKSLK